MARNYTLKTGVTRKLEGATALGLRPFFEFDELESPVCLFIVEAVKIQFFEEKKGGFAANNKIALQVLAHDGLDYSILLSGQTQFQLAKGIGLTDAERQQQKADLATESDMSEDEDLNQRVQPYVDNGYLFVFEGKSQDGFNNFSCHQLDAFGSSEESPHGYLARWADKIFEPEE